MIPIIYYNIIYIYNITIMILLLIDYYYDYYNIYIMLYYFSDL